MDQGKQILLKTFWSKGGYHYTEPAPEAYAIALKEGYMFPEVPKLSHGEMYAALQEVLSQIDPADIANAFLYSLSTRALEYRSALGSYYFAKAIPPHEAAKDCACGICGWKNWGNLTHHYPRHTEENFHNFERYQFGGRHHNVIGYALFDLTQFLKLPGVQPSKTDKAMLRDILMTAAELEPQKKAGAYRALLVKKKIIPGNSAEIRTLLDILGYCGILSTPEHPCPEVAFRGSAGIDPPEIRSDISYPLCWWRAENGINEERFWRVFGFSYAEL